MARLQLERHTNEFNDAALAINNTSLQKLITNSLLENWGALERKMADACNLEDFLSHSALFYSLTPTVYLLTLKYLGTIYFNLKTSLHIYIDDKIRDVFLRLRVIMGIAWTKKGKADHAPISSFVNFWRWIPVDEKIDDCRRLRRIAKESWKRFEWGFFIQASSLTLRKPTTFRTLNFIQHRDYFGGIFHTREVPINCV